MSEIEYDPHVIAATKRLIALVGRSGGPEPIKHVPGKRRTELDFGAVKADVIAHEAADVTGVRIELNNGRLGEFREKGSGSRGSADPVASAANKIRKVCKDSAAIVSAHTRLVAQRRELVAKIREALPDLPVDEKGLAHAIENEPGGLTITATERRGLMRRRESPLSVTLVCAGETAHWPRRTYDRSHIDIQISVNWEGLDIDKAIEKLRGILPFIAALPQFDDGDDDGEVIDAEWDDDDENNDDENGNEALREDREIFARDHKTDWKGDDDGDGTDD